MNADTTVHLAHVQAYKLESLDGEKLKHNFALSFR